MDCFANQSKQHQTLDAQFIYAVLVTLLEMIFSEEDKAVIKNDFEEKNRSAYQI